MDVTDKSLETLAVERARAVRMAKLRLAARENQSDNSDDDSFPTDPNYLER